MKKNLKEIKNFKECSKCLQNKNTRQLNLRYQDFKNTYRQHFSSNYTLCESCMNKFIKLIESF